jgi:hypothetical protein
VGSGLSGDESEHLVNKLKPYFRLDLLNLKPSIHPSTLIKTQPAIYIHISLLLCMLLDKCSLFSDCIG